MSSNNNAMDGMRGDTNKRRELKIRDEFLKILRDNTFNGADGGDVINHISKILEINECIRIPDVDMNQLRLHVFSKSLSGDAKNWWNKEIEGTTIGWNEMCKKLSIKYYPLSHSYNSKVPYNLDNEIDYLEFLYWLALKFNNYWEIDKNTQNGLWKFYVNERTKVTIRDLDDEPRDENYKKTCSDSFYKPYLDAQDGKDIYEIIDREYTLIPVPAYRDIINPDELCKTEEFTVMRYSMGLDEEFVAVEPSKISTMERNPGSMSCIYHDLFNKKDCGWNITRIN
ncbi:hypothetical protein Tco_1428019 [Tanacetum coccineum]